MKIYLDNCCYHRPYDDQRQLIISLETQAKLHIQNCIRNNKYELVSSFVLLYEISRNPNPFNSENILSFIEKYSTLFVSESELSDIEVIAEDIQTTGIKTMDAWHVACAIKAETDYFLTTDKRLLKFSTDKIKMANPIEFVSLMEEEQ